MTPTRRAPTIVVPCFNEESRLSPEGFSSLVSTGRVVLLFVDDGSTDGTAAVLEDMAHDTKPSGAVEVLRLGANVGKAEAVRQGLLRAIDTGAELVGYYDADLATPPAELLRLVDLAERRPELVGVLGARVSRLGGVIERQVLRHYLGRIYATLASAVLRVPVYDTQCGAKVFRVNESVIGALAAPFRTTWAFDVELLQRLLGGAGGAPAVPQTAFVEIPLDSWRDVAGSKLSVFASIRALIELLALARPKRRTTPAPPVTSTRPAPIKKVRSSAPIKEVSAEAEAPSAQPGA